MDGSLTCPSERKKPVYKVIRLEIYIWHIFLITVPVLVLMSDDVTCCAFTKNSIGWNDVAFSAHVETKPVCISFFFFCFLAARLPPLPPRCSSPRIAHFLVFSGSLPFVIRSLNYRFLEFSPALHPTAECLWTWANLVQLKQNSILYLYSEQNFLLK